MPPSQATSAAATATTIVASSRPSTPSALPPLLRGQTGAGEIEPVHGLVGDAPDPLRDEDARVQHRVRGERRVGALDVDPEPPVRAVARDALQPLRGVDRARDPRAREV